MAIIKQTAAPATSIAEPALRGVARNRSVIIVPAILRKRRMGMVT